MPRKRSKQGHRVEHVLTSARRLARIHPKHEWWAECRASVLAWTQVILKGAIVWIEPPHDATEGAIEAVKKRALDLGAIGLRVLPPAPSPDLIPSDTEMVHRAAYTTEDMERVVYELAENVKGVDQESLRLAIDECFEEARG